jgi:predicted Ser/Thr protein kinase
MVLLFLVDTAYLNTSLKEPLVKSSMVNWLKRVAAEVGTGKELAVKLELRENKQNSLKYEASIYQLLTGEEGFPKFYWYGSEGDYNVLVMELLGHSLESLLQLCEQRFSLATTFVLAEQMVIVFFILVSQN